MSSMPFSCVRTQWPIHLHFLSASTLSHFAGCILTFSLYSSFFDAAMRSKFVGDASIYYFEVEWPSTKMSWSDFRGKFLGPTDPANAPDGSLRKEILIKYKDLGLTSEPNQGDNGVHASASPFEGLAEKVVSHDPNKQSTFWEKLEN